MIQVIAGEKGSGKTKVLIEMANQCGKNTNGHVVFIDDDNRHMYDLHYNIRFVKTNYKIENTKTLFGFICGILSQDSDIEHIFMDVIKEASSEEIDEFIKSIEEISANENVDFTFIVSAKTDALTDLAKKYLAS